MRRICVSLLAILILASCSAVSTAAIPADFTWDDVFTAGDLVGFQTGFSTSASNGGGPFRMYKVANGKNLETFCVENLEALNSGQVSSISTQADTGANTFGRSSKTGRVLQEYGAWVYYTYKSNWSIWNTVNTAANRGDLVGAIQDAIWWSMQDDSVTPAAASGAVNELEENSIARGRAFSTIGNSLAAWDATAMDTLLDGVGLGAADFVPGALNAIASPGERVFIYNITDAGSPPSSFKQDMIGLDIPGGAQFPEPASLMVWALLGAGAAAVGARRRPRGWSNQARQSIHRVIDRS